MTGHQNTFQVWHSKIDNEQQTSNYHEQNCTLYRYVLFCMWHFNDFILVDNPVFVPQRFIRGVPKKRLNPTGW